MSKPSPDASKRTNSTASDQPLRVTPADHVRMLADLLQPATPDLARRWLAALLMVPQAERQAIVQAVEARIVSQFGTAQEHTTDTVGSDTAATIEVVHPPVQRPGYIEQVITTYEKMDAPRIARRTPVSPTPRATDYGSA